MGYFGQNEYSAMKHGLKRSVLTSAADPMDPREASLDVHTSLEMICDYRFSPLASFQV